MKKIKNFLLLALVAVSTTTLVSCEKNEEDPSKPSIALVSPSTKEVNVAAGATVNVEVLTAAGDAKLKSFRVEFSTGGPFASYANAFPNGKSDTTYNENNFTYKKALETLNGTGTITYRFVSTDKDDNSSSLELKINVTSGAADINSYSAKLLGNQSNSTNGSFLSTTNGTVYNQANAKTNSTLVDVLYYYGQNNLATLAAPNDAAAGTIYNNPNTGIQTWSKKNATVYQETNLSPAQFNSINSAAGIGTNYLLLNPTASAVTQLANDDVIAFRTEAGKRGFILVKTITGAGTATGSISIDVKVEK